MMSPSTAELDVARRLVFRSVLVPGGWVVAGAMLLSTAAVRWIRTGPGSRFGGLELADNLRTGALSPDWGTWVALCVYSIVGVGGAFIATATVGRRAVVIVRALFCAAGMIAFILLAWGVLPVDRWSAGPTLATIAFALSVALSACQLLTRPSPPTERT